MSDAGLRSLLLAAADDELIIGHRHSEWTGWASHIEEDIAFSSIAQDEIGHANLFYKLLSEIDGRTPDEIALSRQPSEYRHASLCERPNGDWAYTLARHFLYDSAEQIRLEAFAESSYSPLADVSEKLLREERYHRLHAEAWLQRLANGPVEGRHQISAALITAMGDAVGLFEQIEDEENALADKVMPIASQELLQQWLDQVTKQIETAGITLDFSSNEAAEFLPTSSGELAQGAPGVTQPSIALKDGRWVIDETHPGFGGRRGVHSEDFAPLWDDLTRTYREAPTATW